MSPEVRSSPCSRHFSCALANVIRRDIESTLLQMRAWRHDERYQVKPAAHSHFFSLLPVFMTEVELYIRHEQNDCTALKKLNLITWGWIILYMLKDSRPSQSAHLPYRTSRKRNDLQLHSEGENWRFCSTSQMSRSWRCLFERAVSDRWQSRFGSTRIRIAPLSSALARISRWSSGYDFSIVTAEGRSLMKTFRIRDWHIPVKHQAQSLWDSSLGRTY